MTSWSRWTASSCGCRRLDKVLYPEAGTTKAEVLDYYARIAPRAAAAPGRPAGDPDPLAGRRRGRPFFEKNVPSHAPDWLRTVVLPTPGSTRQPGDAALPDHRVTLAGLIWAANLAALELHVPQWTVGPRGGVHNPDRLVIDLDPGPPAGLGRMCRGRPPDRRPAGHRRAQRGAGHQRQQGPAALRSAGRLAARRAGLTATPSGWPSRWPGEHPNLLVAKMAKSLRGGKVLLDWSQNNPAKTTICPYSLRGRAQPWVAAPRSWDEVGAPVAWPAERRRGARPGRRPTATWPPRCSTTRRRHADD